MKSPSGSFQPVGAQRVCVVLLTVLALASAGFAQITSGQKAKVKGQITSRKGDVVKIQDDKTGSPVLVKITDDTKIIRDKSKVAFHRHEDMDVTAMVPGLTIAAEGVGNADNQLEASKITFSPDAFAIEVAQQQEINANKSAASNAQTTANQGVAAAGNAQTSANQAQTTADAAGTVATAAGSIAMMNAGAVEMVNKRVSRRLPDSCRSGHLLSYGSVCPGCPREGGPRQAYRSHVVYGWLLDRDSGLCIQDWN
jgi:hypothetical protein